VEYTRIIQKREGNSLEKSGKEREKETHVKSLFSPSFHHGAQGK
jgi:hypothetical protein